MTLNSTEVLEVLNRIIDPCSAAMGQPAGLVDMGMIESVRIEESPAGSRISIELLMTEAGCLMSVPFRIQAADDLRALPDISDVEITLNTTREWSEERMTDGLRTALAERRETRRQMLGIPRVRPAGAA